MHEPGTASVSRRPRWPATAAWAYLGLGAALSLALVALRDTSLAAVPLGVVGLGTSVAVVTGRRLNRPTVTTPWTYFSVASIAFVIGAVLRQVLDGKPLAPLADAATLTGYTTTLAAFVSLLRNRSSGGSRMHELVDGVIVLVSSAAVALVVFAVPLIQRLGASPFTILQGAYPVIDVAVAFVTVLLFWTSANRVVSYWLLSGCMVAILVGDIGYAWIGTRGHTVGSPLLDLPYVLAFAAFGAAALHPSMVDLSAIQRRSVQIWSGGRLVVLTLALVAPPVVVIEYQDLKYVDWVCGIASALVAVLLLVRAVGAVREHTAAQHGLRYQATHDSLTGLANRARLVERVTALLRRAEAAGDEVDLLFLDIDSFKLVNDTWGHQVGDQLLISAAERLVALTGPTDVVARIGGDEFVVAHYVVTGQSRTGDELAADLLDAFREPLDAPGLPLVASVSVGLARSRHPATAESLLRDADTAMYRAKGAGRNRCVTFDSSMHDAVRRRVETELALRHALDGGQFELHYQPIVELSSQRLLGFEALLRWRHPGMGMVSPLDFIPVAEETGLIVEIGEWVVSEALRQLALWRQRGHEDIWVSVNVSPRQLRDASLVEHVERELLRLDIPADRLVVEITESAMMTDERTAGHLLHRLRDLGVPIAVDDFGTGYSSLGHLRRFPVSKVKIDRAFVAGVVVDNDDAEIVRAVVAMSLAMGLEVVAEGIEEDGQRELLRLAGVQLGQGWLFGRPMPAEDCVLPVVAGPSVA